MNGPAKTATATPHPWSGVAWARYRFRACFSRRAYYKRRLLYAREHDYRICFESYVARAVNEYYQRFDQERDRVWICEHEGIMVGSLFLMHRENEAAQLRFFLILPEYRGIGLGKLLMERFMASLRGLGYKSAFLWTERDLTAAASLYARHGFRQTEQKASDIFGRPATECRYDLATVR